MKSLLGWSAVILLLAPSLLRAQADPPNISAHPKPNVLPSRVKLSAPADDQVIFDLAETTSFPIAGKVTDPSVSTIAVRVTTSHGEQEIFRAPVKDGAFAFDLRHPPGADAAALPWIPSLLYVDFIIPTDAGKLPLSEKEVLYILVDKKTRAYPAIITPFTSGLIDDQGRVDSAALTFPVYRTLANLFMGSRNAAYYTPIFKRGQADFDLARPNDLKFFKDYLTMYDCLMRDHFDQPMGLRAARTFWMSTYLKWFDDAVADPAPPEMQKKYGINYVPYVFTNDFCDILISMLYRSHAWGLLPHEGLDQSLDEAVCNLMQLQHTDNRDLSIGYGTGSFFYGMFFDGRPMVNGTGWFRNPAFLDYVDGGVLNGRAAWGLGNYLKLARDTALKDRVAQSLRAVVKWCLIDTDGMVSPQNKNFLLLKRSPHGYRYWRDPGEHAYLLLGMLAALEKYPGLMIVEPTKTTPGVSLHDLTVEGLNALVDVLGDNHYWSEYANVDSEAIAALAIGSRQLSENSKARQWGDAADKVALGWCQAQDAHHPGDLTHFGLRLSDGIMTYHIPGISRGGEQTNSYFGYQDGHWLQALVELNKIHPNPVYEARMKRLIGFMAGHNAFNIRILNEMGWVNNWVDDVGDTGTENYLKYDPYPESTCFFQIGLYEYMRAFTHAAPSPDQKVGKAY